MIGSDCPEMVWSSKLFSKQFREARVISLNSQEILSSAVAGFGVDELDLNSFQSYLKRLGLDIEVEPQIAVEDDLRSRGVLADLGGSACATVYGLLAFGKSP